MFLATHSSRGIRSKLICGVWKEIRMQDVHGKGVGWLMMGSRTLGGNRGSHELQELTEEKKYSSGYLEIRMKKMEGTGEIKEIKKFY